MLKQRRGGVMAMTMMMEDIAMPARARKRGCSSSSPSSFSSSRIHHYRLKQRAIVAGLTRAGVAGPKSVAPVPTATLRSGAESPKYSPSGRPGRAVSARHLAAALWEMTEIPSPGLSGSKAAVLERQKMRSGRGSSASLPPHSGSPTFSEVDRSGIAIGRRKPSTSRRHTSAEFDSISNASFLETGLEDVSNALTTSKQLLKIITRIWAHQADQPSSTMPVASALHAELERARTQVNRLVHEQRTGRDEAQQTVVEAAVASVAGELEAERRLRRRLEGLNKRLGKELSEIKSAFVKAVRELESERRARETTERLCRELARNPVSARVSSARSSLTGEW
ncbi:hypothetical protein AAHA92_01768 [Salvia divinorum]|uniref:Uncharacterized protein n=1 Tax=Salvia divinorum TaxID=28513 RepID=A0ABD1ICA3_SALDI